jgi:AraC family transcriptional activator FtrA
MRPHRVAVPLTAGAPVFETAIPCEIFGRCRPGLPEPWYELRVCPPDGEPTVASNGFTVVGERGYAGLLDADTVVVPALGDSSQDPPADLVAAVRAAHQAGARVVSLCSGAFVLAAAGILDGRPATTHWIYAEDFRRRFPAVRLDPSVLYVDDGDVLTSSGTTAGIDLCLHIVRLDHGAAVTNTLARRLVAPAHRSGGQAQYIESPAPPPHTDVGLAPLLDWMRAHLDKPLTVTDLARRANLAERTLIRQFHATTGTTPIKWLTEQRVLYARQLLETSDLPIDRVASLAGLGSPANFRHHFGLTMGVSPSTYRREFRASAA